MTAGGSGFLLTNWTGYYTDYHGLELSAVKRLSNRWMGRVGFAFNNAREHYAPQAMYDTNGNPTRDDHRAARRRRPVRAAEHRQRLGQRLHQRASGSSTRTAMYQAPYGIELAANVFGRQGYPFPLFRHAARSAPTRRCRCWSRRRSTRSAIERVGHRPARGADVQGQRGEPAASSATCSTCSTPNTALVRNNNIAVDDVQRDRAESQPADLPGRRRRRVLGVSTEVLQPGARVSCTRGTPPPPAPELRRVIHALEVHQLVDHHVVAHEVRHRHQPPVQADVAAARARSPARSSDCGC